MSDDHIDLLPMPADLAAAIRAFLVDRKRGNVTLNIKDGVILGAHIEEIIAAKGSPPARRRTA